MFLGCSHTRQWSFFPPSSHFILTTGVRSDLFYPHFPDEETEAQTGQVIYPPSQASKQEPGFEPRAHGSSCGSCNKRPQTRWLTTEVCFHTSAGQKHQNQVPAGPCFSKVLEKSCSLLLPASAVSALLVLKSSCGPYRLRSGSQNPGTEEDPPPRVLGAHGLGGGRGL